MRKRYVQVNGILCERGTEPQSTGPMVMPDIKPYRSMIDGSVIKSRSQHWEHLRAHDCVEIGNDINSIKPQTGIPDVNPEDRKEMIRAQIDAMSHAEFKRAGRREIERVRWNSRKD